MAYECAGCEHTTALHFRDVDGVARCLWSDSGVSSRGIIGLPYSIDCDCADFVSKMGDYRRERRQAEENEKMVERLVGKVRERFEEKP